MAKRKQTTRTPSKRPTPSRRERRQTQQDASKHREKPILPSARRFTRQDILPILALGLLVVVCYLPVMLWGGFVWDDSILTDAKPVQDVSGLWQIWFFPSAIEGERHYWPLVYTTFWLEHKLWGFDPTGYHIVNVLMHLVNTLLVWHLMRRLSVPGAWVVAAVFAVHPLHVESVAWVIERKDVLSGLFYLSAALAWMRFVEQPRPRYYVGSLVLYAAALLSKSIVITLPVALLIWHWWQQGRVTSTDLLRLVPFCAIGLVITVGDLSFYASLTGAFDVIDYSLTERTLIAACALWFYAGKLLWPSELAVIYPRWDIRVTDPLAWGYLIAAVALVVVLWHFRHQLGRGPLAGALFFGFTLLPVLGFVDYGYMQFSFVADRFQYLAGIGVMAVVIGAAAYGGCRLPAFWQKGAQAVAAVVIVVLGLLTWRQVGIWSDDETHLRHIISHNPQAWDVHFSLGRVLFDQKRYDEAIAVCRVAIEQRPDHAKAHNITGAALHRLGRFEEAEIYLRRAIQINPQIQNTHAHLGAALSEQGRLEEAITAYRVAIEQRPDHFEVLFNLGALFNTLERFEEAEIYLRRAIQINPQDTDSHQELAKVLFQMGQDAQDNEQLEVATEYYMRALEIDPHYTKAIRRLAHLRSEQQRYDEALELFQRLIDINPSDAVVHGNMGVVLFYLGRSDEALQHFDQALSLDPTLENVRDNREAVLKAMEAAQD